MAARVTDRASLRFVIAFPVFGLILTFVIFHLKFRYRILLFIIDVNKVVHKYYTCATVL
jgi:hypothetical protein